MTTRILSPRSSRRRNRLVSRPRGIVFGTDFSDNAYRAGSAAAAVARRFGAPLTLLHSLEFPNLKATSTARALRWLKNSREEELREEAEDLRGQGVEVETKFTTGRPDEALVEFSETEEPRLLVISSLGRRGVDRWFLGSVAERTAERASVPTLVIREAEPWVRWAEGKRPLKVFVCFNHTLTSEAALRWVKELAAAGPCEITVGWANWPAEEWRRLGCPGPLSLTNNPPEIQRALERDLKEKTAELLGGIPFRVRVDANWGRVDYRLAEMAREEGADVIVVGSHQYRGFERFWHSSVSRGLLCGASMSVVVVPWVSGKVRQTSLPPPPRCVLVATDFSDLANAAISKAYSLMRGGGTVHLLHVLPKMGELPGESEEQSVNRRAGKDPEVRECLEALRALVPVEAEAQGIFTEVRVVRGRDVTETICQHAENLGADLICLGSHGRSGLSGALMGSVAQEVMTRSRRPLLIIRQTAT